MKVIQTVRTELHSALAVGPVTSLGGCARALPDLKAVLASEVSNCVTPQPLNRKTNLFLQRPALTSALGMVSAQH